MGRCQRSPQTQPCAGTWARVGFKYSQCEGLSCKSGLGVSGLAPLEFRMLQLKPQERQGEGGNGCCSKPSLLGWEKSQRIWGAGPLHLHPAPAVSEWDLSPSGSISIVLLSTTVSPRPPLLSWQSCSHGPNAFQPALHFQCPGVPLRAHPPILLSLPGSFLPSLAASTGQGKRECQHHGGIAARLARASPPSIRIRPPSSFTSCLGPSEVLSLQL